MSALDWSADKRIVVEVRKALKGARKAGSSTDFAKLSPIELPKELEVGRGETICVEIKNKHGRRFYFTEHSLYFEKNRHFVRLPYESIASCHWIEVVPDMEEMVRQKREHGDRLILEDTEGERYELDALGWAFQGMYAFFSWLKRRREMAV